MSPEEQLRSRLKSILDVEGATVVEPPCLADMDTGPRPSERSVATQYIACAPLHDTVQPSSQPRGWLLLIVGAIVGIAVMGVIFIIFRKDKTLDKPTTRGKRNHRQAYDDVYDDVYDGSDEDYDDRDLPLSPPKIVKKHPNGQIRSAERPTPKRAAARATALPQSDDPMFQLLQ